MNSEFPPVNLKPSRSVHVVELWAIGQRQEKT